MTTYTKIIASTIIALLVIFVGVYLYTSNKPAPAPVPPPPPAPVVKPSSTVSYACDAGRTITAAFYTNADNPPGATTKQPVPGEKVELTMNGDASATAPAPSIMTLPKVVSADGTRYTTLDGSFSFVNKGNSAIFLENNVSKSYTGCIVSAPLAQGSTLVRVYASSSAGFSMRLPLFTVSTSSASADAYRVDGSYVFKELGPGKGIAGVRFTIPSSMATGTNLSADSFISVEHLSVVGSTTGSTTGNTTECSARLFLAKGAATSTLVEGDTTYSLASSSEAAAGNRYEETVYAISGTKPCLAVRYFIHYGAFENYPKDTVKQFDIVALRDLFDKMRKTVVVSQ